MWHVGSSTNNVQTLCCAAVGFSALSGWVEVGVHFVLNYSAHKQRGAAWKRMSFCLGIIDMQSGKYLLAHSVLLLPELLRSASDCLGFLQQCLTQRTLGRASGKVLNPCFLLGMVIFLSMDLVLKTLPSGVLEVREPGIFQP